MRRRRHAWGRSLALVWVAACAGGPAESSQVEPSTARQPVAAEDSAEPPGPAALADEAAPEPSVDDPEPAEAFGRDSANEAGLDGGPSSPGDADPPSPGAQVDTEPATETEPTAPSDLDPSEANAEPPPPTTEPTTEDEALAADGGTLAPELQLVDQPRWIRHRRAPRETLRQVAIRHGVSTSKLREWNGLGPTDPAPHRRKRLRVWARRMPPPRERVDYEVQEGDTWWSVGLRHGVDGRDLRAYNWPARKKMRPGAMLQIWIDPVVHQWISDGPDPLPPDLDRQFRRGAISIGSPNDGVLVNGLRIPDTEGIKLRIPKSAYGTSHAIEQLLQACAAFRERSDYPLDIPFGSMSRPRGGPLGGHLSHQSGRDIDIKLFRRLDVAAWREIRGSRVYWPAVWDLVRELAAVDVQVIFLDQHAQRRLFRAARQSGADESEIAAARRLVRHSPGHEHHLHVRFRCGPFEPECVP